MIKNFKKKMEFVSVQFENKLFCWNFILIYNNKVLSYDVPTYFIRQIYFCSFRKK